MEVFGVSRCILLVKNLTHTIFICKDNGVLEVLFIVFYLCPNSLVRKKNFNKSPTQLNIV